MYCRYYFTSGSVRSILFVLLVLAFGGPVSAQVRKVAITEYKTGYLDKEGNFYSYLNWDLAKYDFGERKIVDVTSGFNVLLAMDDQGYVWTSRLRDWLMTRIDTDTTGAAFDNNTSIYGYANTHTSIRADGSVWYWGDDTFHLYHTTGAINMRPVRLSPAKMKVKKVVMGLLRILVLTTNGQVWEWTRGGSLKPVQKMIPRPAVDIFCSQWNYAGCIIPDASGPQTMGYPYIWGTDFGFWGGNAPYDQPTSIKALWKLTVPIKDIAANYNTIHYIDAQGRLFGIGDNAMGEIGNGVELVNKHNYQSPYGWTFTKDEYLTHAPPIQVGKGIKWKKLFSNNFLAFYKYALDENDSLYFWGRDKAMVSGRGYLNLQEAAHPNAMDVLVPTMVHPLTAKLQTFNFKMPEISAGKNQTVTGSSVVLKGSATPPLFVRNRSVSNGGMEGVDYKIVSYKWTKVKGPGCVIVSPDSASTTVTGLVPGVYIFNLLATDSHTGTHSANVMVTVEKE